MPVSTDVNLPKSHPAVFPDRCIACGVDEPGVSYRVGTNAIGWWTLAFWSFGRRFTVDVPACESCRDRMHRQRWFRLAVSAVGVVIGVGVAFFLLQWYEGPFKRWFAMGIALACLLPVFLWETFFPRPIDLTAYSNTVDYEFLDPDYAEAFAELNRMPQADPRPASLT
ncbi:hypothetical protein [Tautonia rosea]|uniref:hypothetical protein n=1 Tax=Tautonia rosea TaxID=2728037 RepID=UPI001475183B|nr:hypothetical protein [Tautonia rosea]